MNPITAGAIYLTIWWTVLFAVLPLGARSHHEDGSAVPGGGEPGSPVIHDMKRKLLTTTVVATVTFGLVMLAIWIFWPQLQALSRRPIV